MISHEHGSGQGMMGWPKTFWYMDNEMVFWVVQGPETYNLVYFRVMGSEADAT